MKFGNALYEEDIRKAAGAGIPWERLKGRSVLIAGAAGMLGKAMTDVLMYKNENDGLDCRIYASGRNRHRAEQRFGREYFENPHFTFLEWDMADKAPDGLPQMDFLLGMASNTHPLAYAARPRDNYNEYLRHEKFAGSVCPAAGRQAGISVLRGDIR